MSDPLIFEESVVHETPVTPFTDKDYAWCIDQQQGSYSSSQIVFDCSTLASSSRFQSWKEAYLEIPLVVSLNDTATNLGVNAPFGVGLKSGYTNLIHSFQVEINGKTVVQLTPYSNIFMNFKQISEWSKDTQAKFGAALGFAKDNPLSFGFSAFGTASSSGDGIYNNLNFGYQTGNLAAAAPVETSNQGFCQRQREAAIDFTQAPWSNFTTATNAGTCGKPYYNSGATLNANTGYKVWFYIAKIRLIDLSTDLFQKLPLIKGANVRITLNVNTGTAAISRAGGPQTMALSTANSNFLGGTFPAMIASMNGGSGCSGINAGTTTLSLNVSIAKVVNSALNANGTSHPTMQACRLYVPLIECNPDFTSQLISAGTKRKIQYSDLVYYKITNVSGTFTQLITNGVSRPKRLLIVPYWSTSNTNAYSPLLSPFDPSPGTTTPLISLTQLNVQLSGQNVWSMNQQYDWEQFLHELSDSGLNGGRISELGSGLMDSLDHQTSYRYYLCNIGRCLPAEASTPKSLQIMGTILSASGVSVDLYIFCEYEKEITIDIVTGQVL